MNKNIINEQNEETSWYTKRDICGICNVDEKTFRRFKKETNLETTVQVKKNLKQGDKNVDYYTEPILQKFQLWLRRNAINAGGQRTEGSIIKQEIHDIVDNSGYKYSKEEILSICNVGHTTFETFASQLLRERDFISVGSIYIGYSNE